ncbi:MAG: hypothetical protein Q8O14_11820 [bacterium]|nr:hypothetical protein [bacterium]
MIHIRCLIQLTFVFLVVLSARLEAHEHKEHHEASPAQDTTLQVNTPAPASAQPPMVMIETGAHHHDVEGGFLDLVADNHATLVHFPIAWVLLLVMLEAWTLAKGRELPPIGQTLAVLVALSFLPTAATGLLHASMMEATPDLQRTIETHRLLALLSALLMVVAAGLRWYASKQRALALRAAYLGLVGLTLLLVLSAGYLGGIVSRS